MTDVPGAKRCCSLNAAYDYGCDVDYHYDYDHDIVCHFGDDDDDDDGGGGGGGGGRRGAAVWLAMLFGQICDSMISPEIDLQNTVFHV